MDNDGKKIYNYLGQDETVIQIALVSGFVQTLRCSNFLENPLSAACCAVIVAILYAAIAGIIISITPEILKPLVSIILIMSILYYLCFKKECKPLITIDENSTYLKIDKIKQEEDKNKLKLGNKQISINY